MSLKCPKQYFISQTLRYAYGTKQSSKGGFCISNVKSLDRKTFIELCNNTPPADTRALKVN